MKDRTNRRDAVERSTIRHPVDNGQRLAEFEPRECKWLRLAGIAVAALAAAVVLLLFSMQVAILSLTQNSSPDAVLAWHPEATVTEAALQEARAAQAADFREMRRLGKDQFSRVRRRLDCLSPRRAASDCSS